MMTGADKNVEDGLMSTEKEQEIVDRILKRAELAQMTRQLKVNLSKVPNPGGSGDGKGKDARKKRTNIGGDREIEEAIKKVSPKKNKINSNSLNGPIKSNDDSRLSPIKPYRRPRTPPPAPPTTSSSMRADETGLLKQGEVPTTPIPQKNQNIMPVMISGVANSRDNNKQSDFDNDLKNSLMTPKPAAQLSRTGSENDIAADLLMYLATSPYTSTSSFKVPKNGMNDISRIPSTPMAYNNGRSSADEDDDPIRFSHMKPGISSPQSTFKVPMHVMHNLPSSAPHSELLMDSPSLYMIAASSSPPKRRFMSSNQNEQNPTPVPAGLLPHIPSTPSRELRSSSHLLKTPNFNMGDYVHNLFSPSPRGAIIASGGNATQNNSTTSTHQDLRSAN